MAINVCLKSEISFSFCFGHDTCACLSYNLQKCPEAFRNAPPQKAEAAIASVLQAPSHKTEANRYCIEVQVSGEHEEFIRSFIVLQFVLRRRYTTVVMLKTNWTAISEHKYIYIYVYIHIYIYTSP